MLGDVLVSSTPRVSISGSMDFRMAKETRPHIARKNGDKENRTLPRRKYLIVEIIFSNCSSGSHKSSIVSACFNGCFLVPFVELIPVSANMIGYIRMVFSMR